MFQVHCFPASSIREDTADEAASRPCTGWCLGGQVKSGH